MKAAVYYGPDDIRIEDLPRPVIGPHEALLDVKVCGICSGDLMDWYAEAKAPSVMGHELAGVIEDVGSGVTAFRPGDRVFVHHHAPCLTCPRCRRGDYVQCDTWRHSALHPGGMAEYVRVPAVNLEHDTFVLDEPLTFEDGALVEPLACVIKGIRRAGLRSGDTVLVIGLGSMGLLHIPALRKFDAGRILCADRVPLRLERARAVGADEVFDVSELDLREAVMNETKGEGANVVIVGPADAHAMVQGISCAAPGATVLFFSPARPGQRIKIDPNKLYFQDISLVTSYSCGPSDTADALEFIRDGVVRADDVVTHRFPLEEAARAFTVARRAEESVKVVLKQ